MGTQFSVELRHLRYFAAVARARGLGRAASALHLAQPALSRQIKDLEDEVGVALLERTPKGVDLTAAGEVFLAGAARVLGAVEAAVDAGRRAALGHEGRCLIGIGRIAMSTRSIADPVMRLHDLLPDVDLVIEEVSAFHQPARLLDGTLDLALSFYPGGEDHLASELWSIVEFNAALLAADHPLARRAIIEPDDLADEPVAFLTPDMLPGPVELLRGALARAGIRSPHEFIYASPQSGVMMVASGRGWGPISMDLQTSPLQGVVVVPVRGFAFPFRADLVWRRDEKRKVVLNVLDALRALRDERTTAPPPKPARRSGAHGLPAGLELRHLRYFAAVADDGGFGRAAGRLGLTQPSLSRQVGDLEYQVGAPLLEREARGVALTDSGRALREGIARVLDELDATLGAARQARRGVVGRCVIGTVPTVAASRFYAAASQASGQRYPLVEIFLEEYPTPRQPDALREGLIDVGICHAYLALTNDPHIAHERLLEDGLDCALLAADHPLASREVLHAPELADVPFLFMHRAFHAPLYDRVYAAFAGLGLRPRVDATYDALHLVWALAAQRKGWALGFASHRRCPPAGLVGVPVEGLHLPWGLDLLWRRHEVNPVVAKVLDVMREVRDGTARSAVTLPRKRPARTPARRPQARKTVH